MRLNPTALQVIRERSGLSVSELARRSGVSQPHLSNLERGRRDASPATVKRLAVALDVPILALLADPDAVRDARDPETRVAHSTAGCAPPTAR
jgi:transcriptional regulator with XRE-family HTH domain